jgi:cytochrome c peroxidase
MISQRWLWLALLLAGLGSFVVSNSETSLTAAEPTPSYDWLVPNDALKTPFEKQVPILFVSRGRNKVEWEGLKSYWNETEEKAYNPATGQTVLRKAIKIKLPLGINVPPSVPNENPMTLGGWKLGKELYFDPVLSSDGSTSCSSCHAPDRGYTDQAKVSTGIFGKKGGMNAPSVFNSAMNRFQFWDGRAASLEEQAQGPPGNDVEMFDGKGIAWHSAIKRIREKTDYVKRFEKEYGCLPTRDAVAKAIATYERTVIVGNSIIDRAEVATRKRVTEDEGTDFTVTPKDYETVLQAAIASKDMNALTALEIDPTKDAAKIPTIAQGITNGQKLFFGKARCNSCHVGESLSDLNFHNIGVGAVDGKFPAGQEGRFGAAPTGHKNPTEFGAFKTPQLRGLLSTAPYMHDGSEKTLEAVVDYYDRGGNANEFLDNKMRDLEAEEAFMKAKVEGKPWTGEKVMTFTSGGRPIIPKKLGLTPQEKKEVVLFLRAYQSDPVDSMVADQKR